MLYLEGASFFFINTYLSQLMIVNFVAFRVITTTAMVLMRLFMKLK